MIINRRRLITGAAAMIAAPAIVRVSSLMPIKAEPWIKLNDIKIDLDCWTKMPRHIRMTHSINPIGVVVEGSMDGYKWVKLS